MRFLFPLVALLAFSGFATAQDCSNGQCSTRRPVASVAAPVVRVVKAERRFVASHPGPVRRFVAAFVRR